MWDLFARMHYTLILYEKNGKNIVSVLLSLADNIKLRSLLCVEF